MTADPIDLKHMNHAVALAHQGQGRVEPNPQVGCVIAHGDQVVGEGWHRSFGGPHAEVEALVAAGESARGATLYVSLEPCCHQGKTPPCTDAIRRAGLARVVVAQRDPFPAVAGKGIQQLQQAGIQVDLGIGAEAARRITAPYTKRIEQRRPWVIAKWAMTLDGKLASPAGNSQWISSAASRDIVHELRGRVDAILVGSGTAIHDDPLLTARPPGPRVASRIVFDSEARLPLSTQLVKTARQIPVIIATSTTCDAERVAGLTQAGCQVLACKGVDHPARLDDLLEQLADRQMTNVLVEGGGRLLGNLFDLRQIDEVHVFIGPKLIGGSNSVTPIEGRGIDELPQALRLDDPQFRQIDHDVYVTGWIADPASGRSRSLD